MASDPLTRATASLYGLALGDALGSQFFVPANREALAARTLPPGPWQWTDDTEMACSLYRLLAGRGMVDQDALAASFAAHHDFDRGYGPATGTPPGGVRDGIGAARRLLTIADPVLAARALGNGRNTAAHDTLPFTLWAAARHLDDVERAIWTTATAGGDVDTTCAIVGGVLGGRTGLGGLPRDWLRRMEPLPGWAEVPAGLRPETADGSWPHSTAGVPADR
ncbi:ADP-ribosylglycohydrolase family protein [Microbispora hainanensis]|uniref:ADP-ribosylglycohydrolase family protein n=1 Tax=Microbispora hainanensis TaxID=568844 RepID=A0A544YRM5_9ACTN|nr:ADP-ribosylglycohydrolase family protein [Microbispora hainanensis]TQS19419.1 ADP-ribosylglycohydrolase family protein [Microbispora hainanensis]